MIAVRRLSTFALAVFPWQVSVLAQTDSQRARELIAHLTFESHQVSGDPAHADNHPSIALAEYLQNRKTAQSLVALGAGAASQLNVALESLADAGTQSKYSRNAGWLMLAYARIEGEPAFYRLQRVGGAGKLAFLVPSFDRAAALALGLTSYVTSLRPIHIYFGAPEQWAFSRFHPDWPRDGLDTFILALEKGDDHVLELSLGSNARSAYQQLAATKWLQDIRLKFKREQIAGSSIGYRFLVPGQIAEPEEPLADRPPDILQAVRQPGIHQISTAFVTSRGSECRKITVDFESSPIANAFPPGVRFLIDNRNLRELIKAIGDCSGTAFGK